MLHATTMLFNLSAIYTAPWECLFPQCRCGAGGCWGSCGRGQRESRPGWEQGQGSSISPHCCSPATSCWVCDGIQGWK